MTTLADTSITTEVNVIDNEVLNLEDSVQREYATIDHSRVSPFKYFWPFLVLSLVEGLGGILVSGIAAFLRAARHEEYHMIQITELIVILLIFLALHIFGGIFARYKTRKKNAYLEQIENSRIADIRKLEKRIIELKAQKKELLGEVPVEIPVETPVVTPIETPVQTPAETTLVETTGDNLCVDNALTSKVAELNKIGKGIEDRNIELSRIRVETSLGKVESMYYFWPFLVVSFIFLFFLSSALRIAFNSYPANFASEYFPMIIAAHVFILLHVFGGAFARKMRDGHNKRVDAKHALMHEKIGKLQDELAELEIRNKILLDELKDFDEAELLEI